MASNNKISIFDKIFSYWDAIRPRTSDVTFFPCICVNRSVLSKSYWKECIFIFSIGQLHEAIDFIENQRNAQHRWFRWNLLSSSRDCCWLVYRFANKWVTICNIGSIKMNFRTSYSEVRRHDFLDHAHYVQHLVRNFYSLISWSKLKWFLFHNILDAA